jgi:2'-5' RNA ligase
VTEGADGLGDLTRSLEDHLAVAGWPRDERPFRAHLTLARSDGVAAGPATARALIAASEGFVAEWTADRLLLFESHTGGGPARYEALSEVILTG